jgi:hypothetical protein
MRRDPADQRARLRQAADRVIAQAAAEAHADADDQYLSFLGWRLRITKSAGGVWRGAGVGPDSRGARRADSDARDVDVTVAQARRKRRGLLLSTAPPPIDSPRCKMGRGDGCFYA